VGGGLEDVEHAEGEGSGVVVAAGVVHRLAAAGLGGGEVDVVAEGFEDEDDGLTGAGVELVGETGDEEGDGGGWHEEMVPEIKELGFAKGWMVGVGEDRCGELEVGCWDGRRLVSTEAVVGGDRNRVSCEAEEVSR
jgi:hypothetical protein